MKNRDITTYIYSGRRHGVGPIDFVLIFPGYLATRTRQVLVYAYALLQAALEVAHGLKTVLVSRMFWGRGSLYKNSFHFSVMLLTVGVLLSGVASRVLGGTASQAGLDVSYGLGATNDLLQQGSSIRSVLAVDPTQPEVQIRQHVVQPGETLASIAEQYGVNIDTIRWANGKVVGYFDLSVEVGTVLSIPQMDGVLYEVKRGQTLDTIVRITGGNRSDIIELNKLVPPTYSIAEGQKLFVPSGSLAISEIEVRGIPKGVFVNPLSHPSCQGYHLSRGFTSYHDGLDLAKGGGCPVRAIGPGIVTFVGWSPLAGYNVRIDHGGGIISKYYHSDGTFWVHVGERVQSGQEIMQMGSSGNSTGTHLHLTLTKDGHAVNPAPYVPY